MIKFYSGLRFILSCFLLAVFMFLSSCQNQSGQDTGSMDSTSVVVIPEVDDVDLPQIFERDTLKAITVYGPTSYFLYRGEPLGYEFELVQWLAGHLGIHLKMVIAENLDSMVTLLQHGHGDLIAYNLTVTKERQEKVNFTEYLSLTNQVLVQRKPDNWRKLKQHQIDARMLRSVVDLAGKTIHVRENSAYLQRLQNLEKEIGADIDIQLISGEVTTDEIMAMVDNGEIALTVADYNLARINSAYLDNIDIEMAVSLDQKLAWALRKSSPRLLDTLNYILSQHRGSEGYNVIYNKYFENKRRFRATVKSDLYSKAGGAISPYDDLIKAAASTINWDWRLLASQIFQESEFKPKRQSWMGATGLMQVMPRTAKVYGVSRLNDPKENLKAGTAHLEYLETFWKDSIPDEEERLRFVLASYNAGQYHVEDARRLAAKYGYDPYKWFGQVEKAMLMKANKKYYEDPVVKYGYCRGTEPVNYVTDILQRYEYYTEFIAAGEQSPNDIPHNPGAVGGP